MIWARWLIAASSLILAGYWITRLVAARQRGEPYRTLEVGQAVTCLGMAAMSSPLGGPLAAASWQTVFLLLAAWFLISDRDHAHLHRALSALAMLYMISAAPHGDHFAGEPWLAGTHTGGAALPLLGVLAAGYFAFTAAGCTLRLTIGPRTGTVACELVMAAGTSYLLIDML